mmetsp:Transcript_19641/g.39525  ORF Transcript_19641/g.39525 Transcript_19641/m.39525 type:complete len:219 (+) Transcript_19641:612-1268(+)
MSSDAIDGVLFLPPLPPFLLSLLLSLGVCALLQGILFQFVGLVVFLERVGLWLFLAVDRFVLDLRRRGREEGRDPRRVPVPDVHGSEAFALRDGHRSRPLQTRHSRHCECRLSLPPFLCVLARVSELLHTPRCFSTLHFWDHRFVSVETSKNFLNRVLLLHRRHFCCQFFVLFVHLGVVALACMQNELPAVSPCLQRSEVSSRRKFVLGVLLDCKHVL